jgi:Flp pilus assembly protein TadG
MQAAADSAALASVRELQLARTDANRVTVIANNIVNDLLQNVTTDVKVDFKAMTVQVSIKNSHKPFIRIASDTELSVTAKAKMSGSLPLCLLGLDLSAPHTVSLENSAMMTAPGCLVQSNSKNIAGMQSKLNAKLTAGMICSAGGVLLSIGANYSPKPTTDCPTLLDPLRSRPVPSIGPCNYYNVVIDGEHRTLAPGVYCGGLKLTKDAVVKLSAGIFVIKDGPLVVNRGASVSGTDVAIQLNGKGANLTFDADSTISLSAPKDGPLAGILIYDDPSGAAAPGGKALSGRGIVRNLLKTGAPRQHQILSDNARNLLGTIYMPEGEIIIDALKPIADQSAYTVLIVKQIHLYSGPNLILNTDYSATEVPVPMGVGPYSARIFLTN